MKNIFLNLQKKIQELKEAGVKVKDEKVQRLIAEGY